MILTKCGFLHLYENVFGIAYSHMINLLNMLFFQESHDTGSDYLVPGPPMFHGAPPLVKVMVVNRCKCSTGCKDSETPKDGGEIDTSNRRHETTRTPDPASADGGSTESATSDGQQNEETTSPPSEGGDTILPPR